MTKVSKITEKSVKEARQLAVQGYNHDEIGQYFGFTGRTLRGFLYPSRESASIDINLANQMSEAINTGRALSIEPLGDLMLYKMEVMEDARDKLRELKSEYGITTSELGSDLGREELHKLAKHQVINLINATDDYSKALQEYISAQDENEKLKEWMKRRASLKRYRPVDIKIDDRHEMRSVIKENGVSAHQLEMQVSYLDRIENGELPF